MAPSMHSDVTTFPGNSSGHFTHHLLRPRSTEEDSKPNAAIIVLIVFVSFLLLISLIALLIRCYSRIRYSRVFNSEDYLAVFAFVFAAILVLFSIWQLLYGIGPAMYVEHDRPRPPPSGTPFPVGFYNVNGNEAGAPGWAGNKPIWKQELMLLSGPILAPMVHLTGVTLIKLSLLVFYRRLVPSNRFRAICMGTIVFVIASWVALMGALLFQCRPFWAMWHVKSLPTARCVKPEYLFLSIGIVGFVADVIVFILPIPVVIRSGLPKGQKRHVLCVFFIGIIILVSSAIRVILIGRTLNVTHRDIFRRVVIRMIAGVMELELAVIVACLPACKLFMTRKFHIFVMPTTPQYIWTPEVSACRKAEIRMRDLENADTVNIPGPSSSDSQTELRPVSMGVVDDDVLLNRRDET